MLILWGMRRPVKLATRNQTNNFILTLANEWSLSCCSWLLQILRVISFPSPPLAHASQVIVLNRLSVGAICRSVRRDVFICCMVIFIPQDPLWICYSFSPAGGSNKTIKTTNIGSAKNRNVLYNCTKNNMVQRKKVGRLTKTREPDEEKEAVSFWMPTFTLRIVVIQIHWAVNLLTLIYNFLVTIYCFFVFSLARRCCVKYSWV